MKKTWAVLSLLAACVLPAAAQSNQLIDRLLGEPQASFGVAAYLVLAASEALDPEATEQQALDALGEKGWKLRVPQSTAEPIRLGEFCFLIMKAFEEKGGLMYRLFPGPRYAVRELAYLGLVHGKVHSRRFPSGQEVVQILSGYLERKGGGA
jgi:hypothetical protein